MLLDIEVAGAVAPGTKIAVYFAPNTDRGFLDAVTTAVHDIRRKSSVISISWGAPESAWTQQAINNMNDAFQAAAALGVTINPECSRPKFKYFVDVPGGGAAIPRDAG